MVDCTRQPLGKGVNERRRRQTLLDIRFMGEELEVGEQHLDHAGAVDEIGDVGLGDGAAYRLELPSDRQILETEAEPHGLHTGLLERAILSAKAGDPEFSSAGICHPGFPLSRE
jgi:hypothetical protein